MTCQEYTEAVDKINEIMFPLITEDSNVEAVWEAVKQVWATSENEIMEEVVINNEA